MSGHLSLKFVITENQLANIINNFIMNILENQKRTSYWQLTPIVNFKLNDDFAYVLIYLGIMPSYLK